MTVEWCGPWWLKPWLGDSKDSIFHRVTGVELKRRQVPAAVAELRYLQDLRLEACRLTDEQVRQLEQLKSLDSLEMVGSYVIDPAQQIAARAQASPAPSPLPTGDWLQKSNWVELCQGNQGDLAWACPTTAAD